MNFEAEDEPTIDDSIPIIVRVLSKDDEEYIFQFALNKKEIKQLQGELRKALRVLEGRK